jgi:hypothetical protein
MIPADIKVDIARAVRSVRTDLGGRCWFYQMIGAFALTTLGIRAKFHLGGRSRRLVSRSNSGGRAPQSPPGALLDRRRGASLGDKLRGEECFSGPRADDRYGGIVGGGLFLRPSVSHFFRAQEERDLHKTSFQNNRSPAADIVRVAASR